MQKTSRVRYEKMDNVARITLNRPEVLNAMDLRTHEELAEIWDDFEADDDMWVAVLSGAGTRSFSVGQDLKELATREQAGTAAPSTFGSRGKPGWPRLTERFELSKPIVAKVRGTPWAAGSSSPSPVTSSSPPRTRSSPSPKPDSASW